MNSPHFVSPLWWGCGRRRVIHSGLPNRDQIVPMISAVSSDAAHRAATISGWPGNATAVATSTTGLIAGAASMNVSAAAPTAPSLNSLRATGTDPHSQPGSAAPPTPAARIATLVRRGSQRASRSGVTNTAISPLITTPSARKGNACTNTPQNTVAAVATFVVLSTKSRAGPPTSAIAMMVTTRTGMDLDPNRLRVGAGFVATAVILPGLAVN